MIQFPLKAMHGISTDDQSCFAFSKYDVFSCPNFSENYCDNDPIKKNVKCFMAISTFDQRQEPCSCQAVTVRFTRNWHSGLRIFIRS